MSTTHPITDATDLGRRLREVRRAQGLTQDDLALAAGVSRRFVLELEGGKPTCQLGKVLHLLRILGIGVVLEAPPTTTDEAAG